MTNYIKSLLLVGILSSTAGVVGCAATATTKSTGEYVDDAAITAKVKSEMLANEHVKAMHIEVETYKGTVQLSGFADSAAEARTAVDIARSVRGVRTVKNDIVVKH
ncbi:MAG: BON domain-containing protein [Gammaproteobacteria bacterium]